MKRNIVSILIAFILAAGLLPAVAHAQDNREPDTELHEQILKAHKDYVAEKYGATIHVEEDLPESVVLEDPQELDVPKNGHQEIMPEDPRENPEMYEEIIELAALIELEAGNQSTVGRAIVADVVLNRVADPRFPDSIHDVIYQKGQFSVVKQMPQAIENVKQENVEIVLDELCDQVTYSALYFDCYGYVKGTDPLWKYGDHYFSK